MNDVEAAYKLGHTAPMVRRAMVYLWRFADWKRVIGCSDDPSEDLRWRADSTAWALGHLDSHLAPETAEQLRRAQRRLNELVEQMLDAEQADGRWRGQPFGEGPCPGREEWETFDRLAAESLRRRPYLERWRRLGRAVGQIPLQIVGPDQGSGDPTPDSADLMPLIEAAAALSETARRRVPVLGRAAEWSTADAPADLPAMLDAILDERSATPPADAGGRYTYILNRIVALDRAIAQGVYEQLPTFDLDLNDADPGHCQAILNDRAYEVTPEQLLILRSLIKAAGVWLTSEALAADHPALAETRLDRKIRGLPAPIRQRIQTRAGHGGGYRLDLP